MRWRRLACGHVGGGGAGPAGFSSRARSGPRPTTQPAHNIATPAFQYDPDDIEGFRGGLHRLGGEVGATSTGISVYELPAGEALCPYHWETDEEWLILLSGRLRVRHPEGEDEVGPGSIVAFPAGPEGAHKTTTVGDEPARFESALQALADAVDIGADAPAARPLVLDRIG